MEINEKYFTRCKSKETRPGCWNVLDVEVFQKNEDGTETKIGEYERNYNRIYK